jgi:hypothetical protein
VRAHRRAYGAGMIRTIFDCPQTGEPLRSAIGAGEWPGRGHELLSLHCPKCGQLHSFRRAQASLAIEPDRPASAPASA